uniref:Putative transcription initiation factor iia subunit 1 isoform 2 n=1 Tax=Triatoma dimidiata TaxID=72491 RepID=A0A0V0G861_TRIDM
MSLSQSTVARLYASVIEDVIGGVREYFVDEGIDEQVLMELKSSWEKRLQETRAVEVKPDVDPQPPPLLNKQQNNVTKTALSNHLSQNTTGGQASVPIQNVSIQITLPAQQGVPGAQPRAITIQVPASALQGNQLQAVLTGPVISATMSLPQHLATTLLQQHVTAALQGQASASVIQMPTSHATTIQNNENTNNRQTFQTQAQEAGVQSTGGVAQLDGHNDTSDEEDDDDDEEEDEAEEDDDEGDDKEDEENDDLDGGAEEEPLNSGDDVSEEDPSEMFETDNVVVCQYDKITRTRNKWKFYLKDGIMNLGGKDYIFQKSNGDAEW